LPRPERRSGRGLDSPEGLPFSIDWLPDGRLLTTTPDGVVIGPDQAPYGAAGQPFNEIVVDAAGRAWVDMPGAAPWEDPKPGVVAVVLPDGNSHQVADAVWFPNAMVLIGDDTLVVAESHADRLTGWTITDSAELVDRRVWTDLGPGSAPDGICADAEGAIWYASVPGQRCTVSPKAVRCWHHQSRPRVGISGEFAAKSMAVPDRPVRQPANA